MEFYIAGTTFAAPFFGDPVSCYREADSPEKALCELAEQYESGIGLYAANAYASADAYHKGEQALARWRSNKAQVAEASPASSRYSNGPGSIELDGKLVQVEEPKKGAII